MNIAFLLAIAATLLLVGILIGNGLNGRDRIARDKRQARAQLDLNDRERRLEVALHSFYRHREGAD